MPELNGTSFERLIEFVSIDLTAYGDQIHRFVNTSTYENGSPEMSGVTWQGHEWTALPFQSGGFQRGGENQVRPAFQVADFTGALYALFRSLNGAPGAPVVRYQAFAADVESNSPFAAISTERYVIDNVAQQKMTLQVELATELDFASRKVPGFKMLRKDYPGLGSAILRG